HLMNGSIWLESPIKTDTSIKKKGGPGTCFYFTAKLGIGKPLKSLKPSGDMTVLKNKKVLAVDDNPINRAYLKDLLAKEGMNIEIVTNADAVINVLEDARTNDMNYDLLITDSQMPDVNGFMLVEKLNRKNLSEQLPIMMITSAGVRGDSKRCQELGIDAYLTKPIQPSQLFKAMLLIFDPNFEHKKDISLITKYTFNDQSNPWKLLVAEDNPVNQKLIKRILEKAGHEVLIAENGVKVLEAFEQSSYDAILMDIQMPEMDGYETTIKIREIEKQSGKSIPIIALTAHAMKEEVNRCKTVGMDGYVSKPIKTEELFDTLEQILDQKLNNTAKSFKDKWY
ncbi:MAG: response regulator, partial [Caldithrix sp.]|nr:response regulator [Caldithrix sp.]